MRKLLVTLGAVLGLFLVATPAHAAPPDDALAKFKAGDHVFAADGAPAKVDGPKVSDAIGSAEIRIAILPAGAGDAGTLAKQLGEALGGNRTVGVIVGTNFNAASNVYCNAPVSTAARTAVNQHEAQLNENGDVTDTLISWVQAVEGLPTQTSCSSSDSSNGNGAVVSAPADSGSGNGKTGVVIIVVLVLLAALGLGAFMFGRRRKKARELADMRATVMSLYDRLGADVSNLDPKDNAEARQALADASERYTAAGSYLARADSPAKYEVARRTAIEGLYAARTAREKLGLPLGADLPPTETSAEALREPTTVNVKGQDVRGYPDYQPGAPYYYGGGGGYGAGWYSMPFWETLLLTSVLTGGFGGGWGFGGGFGGGGFDSGYQEGYQDASSNFGDQGGGDSGGSWGGDWGGGGGDWGGGGGDWGGGGGDWGGGGGDGGGGSW